MSKRRSKHATPAIDEAESRETARLQGMVRGMADFMRTKRWDLFGTFTFRFEVDELTAVQEFERVYVPRLQQRSQGKVTYAGTAARAPFGRKVHVHALLRLARPLTTREAEAAWRAGQTAVRRFDEARDANGYVAQHVAIPNAEVLLRR